ncbi:MAG: riboflavin kinase, partial [Vicinamibacterales bacterium]
TGADRIAYPAVTNIGVRPTFDAGDAVHIETHVLNLPNASSPPNLYGLSLRLLFVQRLREERRFEGVDALTAQIRADIDEARALFRQVSL